MELKSKCANLKRSGKTAREIYNTIYCEEVSNPADFSTFDRLLRRWTKQIYPNQLTLDKGTYPNFTAHGATVQVSSSGEIVQAWIKQTSDPFDPEDFIEAISKKVAPYSSKSEVSEDSKNMLEIPLFDMHWGIAFMDHYKPVLDSILDVICQHRWKKIIIPFGQDFFHNDSIVNGQTTKGTRIEKVDMQRAVKESQQFMYAIIDKAIEQSDEVKMVYSPGNHDRSISWMFMQVMLARYGPDIVDDSMVFRRVVTYGNNAVMITHGNSKKSTASTLAHIFPISFPEEFSNATTREVHAGHIHKETSSDVYGVMVRHLSSGNKQDEWSDSEDLVGANKRFMLFEWSPEKLRAIYYI